MGNHAKTKLGDNAKRVLIVEDNPLVQHIICHTFKERGFEVDITDTGHEAVKLFKRYDYDFVLLDFGLPDLLGNEVIRLIRKFEYKYISTLSYRCLFCLYGFSSKRRMFCRWG
jgi:DNA-binding response OmpR family regulator